MRRFLRAVAISLGLAALGVGCGLLALGFNPAWQRHRAATLAASFIPYGIVAWLVVALVGATSRRWVVRILAVLVALAAIAGHVWLGRPYWPSWARPDAAAAAPARAGASELTVMTMNLYYGWGRPETLVANQRQWEPDVIVLQEATEDSVARLDAQGWRTLYPHRVGTPQPEWSAKGLVVLSKHPVTRLASSREQTFEAVRLELDSGPVTVIGVHTLNPVVDIEQWRRDLDEIGRAAREASADAPVVVLGDFNATREHVPLQQLMADAALTDAAEQLGRGWTPTYGPRVTLDPSAPVVPYLIGLDHVLLGPGVRAEMLDAVPVPTSDHRGLVARVERR